MYEWLAYAYIYNEMTHRKHHRHYRSVGGSISRELNRYIRY
jgi:hypothetical protein